MQLWGYENVGLKKADENSRRPVERLTPSKARSPKRIRTDGKEINIWRLGLATITLTKQSLTTLARVAYRPSRLFHFWRVVRRAPA